MLLVEARELERIKQKSVRDSNPKLAVLSRLRDEMDVVLRNPALSATQKVTLFTKLMNRFKALQAESGVSSKGVTSPTAIPRSANANALKMDTLDDDTLLNISTSPTTNKRANSTAQSRPKVVRVSDSFKNKPDIPDYSYFDESISKARSALNESKIDLAEMQRIADMRRPARNLDEHLEEADESEVARDSSEPSYEEIASYLHKPKAKKKRKNSTKLSHSEDGAARGSSDPSYEEFARYLYEPKAKEKRKNTPKLPLEGIRPATRYKGNKHVNLHQGGTMVPPGKRYKKQRGGTVKDVLKFTRVLRIY